MAQFNQPCKHILPLQRPTVQSYLNALSTGPQDKYLIVTFPDIKNPYPDDQRKLTQTFIVSGTGGASEKHWDKIEELNQAGAGIFMAVNTKKSMEHRRRKNNDMAGARALFLDVDDPDLACVCPPKLPPSFRVVTSTIPRKKRGKDEINFKYHDYWVFKEPLMDLDQWMDNMVTLVDSHGGDPGACLKTQVLRVPGTVHCKDIKTLAYVELSIPPLEHPVPGGVKRYTARRLNAAFPARKAERIRKERDEHRKEHFEANGVAPMDAIEDDPERLQSVLDYFNANDFPNSLGEMQDAGYAQDMNLAGIGLVDGMNKSVDNYQFWVSVGMAIHATGLDEGFDLWVNWSKERSNWGGVDDAYAKWSSFNTFRRHGGILTISTVFGIAQDLGWDYMPSSPFDDEVEDDEVEVEDDYEVVDKKKPGDYISENDYLEELQNDIPCEPMKELYDIYMKTAIYPYPEFALAPILATCGYIMGRQYHCDGLMANMIIQLIGPSGCGKGHPLNMATKIMKFLGLEEAIVGDVASSEGLEDALFYAPNKSVMGITDENYEKRNNANEQVRKIRSKERELAGGTALIWMPLRKKAKQKDDDIEEGKGIAYPFFMSLNATTDTSFHKAIKSDMVEEGDLGRTVFCITTQGRVRFNPVGTLETMNSLPPKFKEAAQVVLSPAYELEVSSPTDTKIVPVVLDNEATGLFNEGARMEMMGYNAALRDEDTISTQVISRRMEKTKRIAMILATFDNEHDTHGYDAMGISISRIIVRARHMEWAEKWVREMEKRAVQFMKDNVHTDDNDRNNKRFIREIKVMDEKRYRSLQIDEKFKKDFAKYKDLVNAGYIPRSIITKRCHFNDSKLMDKYERIAVETGVIKRINMGVAREKQADSNPKVVKNSKFRGIVYRLRS